MGDYSYVLETSGAYVNWAEIKRFSPNDTPGEYADECRDLGPFVSFDTSFVVLDDPSTGSPILTLDNSLSYWAGIPAYEITSLTAEQLVVRGLQDPYDPPGGQLAWYHTFVPEAGSGPVECAGLQEILAAETTTFLCGRMNLIQTVRLALKTGASN